MNEYLNVLYEIVTRGLNTNSYKFALWRALARQAPERSVITKHTLATLFLEYYWDLEITYHLRQGTDPAKDPIVMVLIRERVKNDIIKSGEKLRDFKNRLPDEYNKLVDTVAREAFDDVIPRFRIVHGRPISPDLYTYSGGIGKVGDEIELLTSGGREFLIQHGKLVDYIAVAAWVRFTERFTSAPKLHQKISGGEVKRGAVSRWRAPLLDIQHGLCFYGEKHDMTHPQVDHVLPWTFVLEDKTWNLVLSCGKCNNGKSDHLTTMEYLSRLCARNESLLKSTSTDGPFFRHFSEWHSRDLSAYVKGLYDQAVADNFPIWKPAAL